MPLRQFLTLLLLLLTTACQPAPRPRLAPAGVSALPLATAGAPRAACWLADGSQLAMAADTLQLFSAADGALQWSRPLAAGLLSCAPGGERLLAAVPGTDQSLLRDCSWPTGSCREARLPGRLLQAAWDRDGRPLLLMLAHQAFRFGENLSYALYRWGGAGPALVRSLADATIHKGRYRQLQAQLTNPANYPLALDGSLLLVPLLHDPPAAAAYFEVRAYDLPGGEDWQVATMGLQGELVAIDDRRESVLIRADGRIAGYDLWGGGRLKGAAAQPLSAAGSPGGRIRVDAAGWHEGQAAVQPLPDGTRAAFAPDGRRVVLWTRHQAVLVTLPQADPASVKSRRVPLATLRDWRAQGLIDAAEYTRLKGSP